MLKFFKMDYRSKILHIIGVSYTLHRSDGRMLTNDRDYNIFVSESGIKLNPLKNTITPDGLRVLLCAYLNCIITSCNKAPIFGGDWDLPVRFITAFVRMSVNLNGDLGKQLDVDRSMGIFKSVCPLQATALGLPFVGRVMMGEYLQYQTLSNMLRICVRQNNLNILYQFNDDVIGSMIIRPVEVFISQIPDDMQDVGFLSTLGRLDFEMSSDVASISYTSAGGRAEVIREGVMTSIAGGRLHSTAAISGVYNVEFFGISGDAPDIIGLYSNLSTSIAPFKATLAKIPPQILDLMMTFLTVLNNGNGLDPYAHADVIIQSSINNNEIRELSLMLLGITAML